jgi:hypothetical protein
MKKIYTSTKFKKYNSARSKKQIRLRRKRKNKEYNPFKTFTGRQKKRQNQIVNIPAPQDFSFIGNTEKTLEYFETAKQQLKKGFSVNFDISEIKTLTTDTIALQIAKIKNDKFRSNNAIYGNAPNDQDLKELFLQSGFYSYVQSKTPRKSVGNKLIHKITENKVEPKIAKEACISGLMHTFGNDEIFDPLYDILIEVMQNTNNHAGETRGKYDWWLHVYNDPLSQTSKYTFLDLGVGIFESLPVKSFKRKIGEALRLSHNSDLVKPLFNGEIKSRTRKPERGKGIPQVYQSSQHPAFKRFYLVSNNVLVDMKNMKINKLNNNFSGTLFYWELIKI